MERSQDPIVLFEHWLKAAARGGVKSPDAMALASTSPEGFPSVRIVLFKGLTDTGELVFFTNYRSRKASELEKNPNVAVAFHWPELERQIRIEGTVEKLSHGISQAYFSTRPRLSQLGAWVSPQSEVIGQGLSGKGLKKLMTQVRLLDRETRDQEIPCPPFWGGYLIRPTTIEFWRGGRGRLHTRFRFERKKSGGWKIVELAP